MLRNVMRVDRSPLNRMRWCLHLVCGHDEWMTSRTRPLRKHHWCSICALDERKRVLHMTGEEPTP